MVLESVAAAAALALSVFVVREPFDPRYCSARSMFMLTSITLAILATYSGEENPYWIRRRSNQKPAAQNRTAGRTSV